MFKVFTKKVEGKEKKNIQINSKAQEKPFPAMWEDSGKNFL